MDIIDVKQAAQYLNLHPEVIRKKAAQGVIPAKKLGSGKKSPWRFLKKDLDRYLKVSDFKIVKEVNENNLYRQMITDLHEEDDLEKIDQILSQLGKLGYESSVDHILGFLESPFEEHRHYAAKALIDILGEESWPYLKIMINDPHDWVRMPVLCYFADKQEIALEQLKELFKRNQHLQIVNTLVPLDWSLVKNIFLQNLNSQNIGIRYKSLMVLKTISVPGEEQILDKFLTDKVLNNRKKALEIIGLKKIESFVPEIQKILVENNPRDLKKIAATALAKIYS